MRLLAIPEVSFSKRQLLSPLPTPPPLPSRSLTQSLADRRRAHTDEDSLLTHILSFPNSLSALINAFAGISPRERHHFSNSLFAFFLAEYRLWRSVFFFSPTSACV
ncbi:hypothetical protein J437_LFUL000804 [Ladona fulva]|uniref:Uncharacterized protein n=1 Tax=Ladona fulva TaxID=123851 RepID=A0A8K0KTT2_LADFU|nr:hypothetical protein J437_LFUL000804 [Ladona fulva]